jgi:hypothetical protein
MSKECRFHSRWEGGGDLCSKARRPGMGPTETNSRVTGAPFWRPENQQYLKFITLYVAGDLSGATDGTMCPGVHSASKNKYQENS